MNRPKFEVAVPKRRYQIGEYTAVVLGDIESSGAISYRYVLAMIVEGSNEPKLYVTLEQEPGSGAKQRNYTLRVIGANLDENLGESEQWNDIQHFTASALSVGMQVLGLTDEIPALLQ